MKNIGLIKKYHVRRVDGRPVGWCFVLEDDDPLTIPALGAYAAAARQAGYEALSIDLLTKICELVDGAALAAQSTEEVTPIHTDP